MKKTILLLILSALCFAASAQMTARKDAAGNYTEIAKPPATAESLTAKATATGKTITTRKGETAPVYATANGKLFIVLTSAKTGNPYRRYVTVAE